MDNDEDQSLKQLRDNGHIRENSGEEKKRCLLDESRLKIQAQSFPGFMSVSGFRGNGLIMVNQSTGQAIKKVYSND